jgi:hypothetical protein
LNSSATWSRRASSADRGFGLVEVCFRLPVRSAHAQPSQIKPMHRHDEQTEIPYDLGNAISADI